MAEQVSEMLEDITMTDVSVDSEDGEQVSTITMKELLNGKEEITTKRPKLKLMMYEQKMAYYDKYGVEGDKLRRLAPSYKITKVFYRSGMEKAVPKWKRRTEYYLGKIAETGSVSEENEPIKVTRSDFVDKAAEKVIKKISERKETVKVFSGHYPEPEDTENAVKMV